MTNPTTTALNVANLNIPHNAAERAARRMRVDGIGRDPENDRVVFLSLSRRPSDDEVRAIQDVLNGRMA